jgi:hypothetical protein
MVFIAVCGNYLQVRKFYDVHSSEAFNEALFYGYPDVAICTISLTEESIYAVK